MIRSVTRLAAAVALAALVPAIPHAAPTSGLQYDEIVRMVVGAPPAPGNFSADAAAITSPAPVAAATPAPRRHGGFGNLGALAGGLLSGNVAGAVAGSATDAIVGNALDARMDAMLAQSGGMFAGALRGLTAGRLERHSFYSGWERVDDVAAQTATITKCDMHQVIRLDLSKKTYTIGDPASAPVETPAPVTKQHSRTHYATPEPQAPGTATAGLSTVVTPLGSRRFDGLDATGYDDASTFSVADATGSCRNGTFGFRSTAYYSRFPAPRLVCPIPDAPAARQRYPQEPANFVASGGCRPTFTVRRTGPVPPAQNLALYSAIRMNASAGGATPDPAASSAPALVFLTERGNVHSLTAANAGLFEIPADFTKAP